MCHQTQHSNLKKEVFLLELSEFMAELRLKIFVKRGAFLKLNLLFRKL